MSTNGSSEPRLAPIALFAYNRADVLTATFSALKKNTLASQSVLYVFSDGPKPGVPDDAADVQEVRDVIAAIDGFKDVNVTLQETNLGLAQSVITGITKVVREHGRIIVLEDDLLTSEYFLTYMNDALSHYADQPDVYCINGMSLGPGIAETATADTYFVYRNSSHGWGTWADRWAKAEWDSTLIDFELSNLYAQLRFDRGGDDLTDMIRSQASGRIDSWAVRWSYSIARQDGRCLSPVHSYVTHQKNDRGTHIRQLVPSLDHDLSRAMAKPSYPATTQIDPEIARKFARNYCDTTPFLLLPNEERLKNPELAAYVEAEVRLSRERSAKEPRGPSIAILTYGPKGGAGIATKTIHNALLATGADSHLIMCDRHGPVVRGFYLADPAKKAASDQVNTYFRKAYQLANSTLMSVDTSSIDKEQIRLLERFDIINLHWVARFLSVEDIAAILDVGKPVVWSMHDRAALTGGCHCFHGCENWLDACEPCPQLRHAKNGYPGLAYAFKAAHLDRSNLTLVTLSDTNAAFFERTPLYKQARRVTIPVPVDTETFRPLGWNEARLQLDIGEEAFVILYSATSGSPAKGAAHVQRAVSRLAATGRGILVLAIGDAADKLALDGTCCRKIGFVGDREQLGALYAAADVTLIPSQEEGMPNVAVESIACGTPILGYDVGIMPELAAVEGVGTVVPVGDEEALYRALAAMPLKSDAVSRVCRDVAVTRFSPEVIARQVMALFDQLLRDPAGAAKAGPRRRDAPDLAAAVDDIAAEALAAMVAEKHQTGEAHTKRIANLEGKASALKAKVADLNSQLNALRSQKKAIRAELAAVNSSLSWSATRPLRLIRERLRRMLRSG